MQANAINATYEASDEDNRTQIRRWALSVALIAAVCCIAILVRKPDQFFRGYLIACLSVWSVSVGAMVLRIVFQLTGGRWGAAGRVWLESAAAMMPIVAVLFIPLAFGLKFLYPWYDTQFFEGLEHVAHRQWYFQPWFFLLRSVIYFSLWIAINFLLLGLPWRRNLNQSKLGGQGIAGVCALLMLVSITWAGNDWIMSINPMFTSSLFGALVGIGALLSAMAFTVAASSFLQLPRKSLIATEVKADLANLLLTMVMLWTYFNFSQFIIFWSGDLPFEAEYYIQRTTGGWLYIAWILIFGGFAIPFLSLFSAKLKRSGRPLGYLALWILLIRIFELDLLILPYYSPGHFHLNLAAFFAPIATIGIWLAGITLVLPGPIGWLDESKLRTGIADDGDNADVGRVEVSQ